jgi:hypothetical protein
MTYQVVRIEVHPSGRQVAPGSASDSRDDAEWRNTVEHQTTEQAVTQRVAHLERAGWEHVATAPDSLKDPHSGGLLLVFWRADPGAGTPTQRGPGDRAWVRDHPHRGRTAAAVPAVDDDPVIRSV